MRVRWTIEATDDLEQIAEYIALVLSPLPFVAVYEVHEQEVQVLRILHGAQRWPPG